jgi:Zn finger protein HypA/HybF involved in hydrogenase expression
MAVSGKSMAVYIISAILIFFGILFLMSARAEYTQNPGGRIVTALVLMGVGIFAIVMAKKNEPKQKIEITQKIDLSGSAKPEEMKCKQCGAPLDKNSVAVKEGAVFINCPYCKGSYQIIEEPKW